MPINLKAPQLKELKPRIVVCGVGGAGGNAINNMIVSGLTGVDFVVANTDAQALASSRAEQIIQMGLQVTAVNNAQGQGRSGSPPRDHHACDAAGRNRVRIGISPRNPRDRRPNPASMRSDALGREQTTAPILLHAANQWPTAIST